MTRTEAQRQAAALCRAMAVDPDAEFKALGEPAGVAIESGDYDAFRAWVAALADALEPPDEAGTVEVEVLAEAYATGEVRIPAQWTGAPRANPSTAGGLRLSRIRARIPLPGLAVVDGEVKDAE